MSTHNPQMDPDVARILADDAAAAGVPIYQQTPIEARAGLLDMVTERGGKPAAVAHIEDRTIPGPGGEIPIRIYKPSDEADLPILAFYHGGGWVLGDIASHDRLCRLLANGAHCIVISVDYRLAPEHKFPAAPEDCYAALQWIAAHGAELGGDPSCIAVGGESAGGNLSAVVALMARDRQGPKICYQLLLYPVTDLTALETPSYNDFATDHGLEKASMAWFIDHYLADLADAQNPYASPLHAPDLSGLPPAAVMTAGFDVLRDEGDAYATRLQEAGVPVTHKCYPGFIHGFYVMTGVIGAARVAVDEACALLRKAFAA
ncbi:MAG: alpha/beta hydrolase [Caldilineaceae bacterium]|nr:alpha/beta hydrolase [Caldilineaceae bacterium]